MCLFDPVTPALIAAAAGGVAYMGYQQQSAQDDMKRYQAQVAANNAAVAKQQMQNAQNQGQLALQQQQIKNASALSGLRAQMAASGLDLNSGSPLNMQASQQMMGNLSDQNIRDSTTNQMYGLSASAMNQNANSQLDNYQASLGDWNRDWSAIQNGAPQGSSMLTSAAGSAYAMATA